MIEPDTASKAPLDEVMLAMDVVDTLRHRERIVERALSTDERDRELVDRLKSIYAGQGIAVSTSIIEQGVRALREDRFVYTPPGPSLARALALAYVSRGSWAPGLSLTLGLLATLLISYQIFVRGPELRFRASLPANLETAYAAVVDLAEPAEVDSRAQSIHDAGQAALAAGDFDGGWAAMEALDALSDSLGQVYQIRVLSAPGELSGVWRVPDANPNAQNYYLIVEAIDADGNRLDLPIMNEESGRVTSVRRWGQRVEPSKFEAIASDKQDDGIIQNAIIGEKRRGYLVPDFAQGVLDGAITNW